MPAFFCESGEGSVNLLPGAVEIQQSACSAKRNTVFSHLCSTHTLLHRLDSQHSTFLGPSDRTAQHAFLGVLPWTLGSQHPLHFLFAAKSVTILCVIFTFWKFWTSLIYVCLFFSLVGLWIVYLFPFILVGFTVESEMLLFKFSG